MVERGAIQDTLRIPEKQFEIKRFSDEAREKLIKEGYAIFELSGRSIGVLKKLDYRFSSTWHRDNSDFESQCSIHSEVAINLKKLYLPKSKNKTFTEQEEMVEKYSKKIGKKIPGVKAIIGEAIDYIDLEAVHLKDRYLFGKKFKHDYVRTKAPLGSGHILVGADEDFCGMNVEMLDGILSRSFKRVIVPLVVPV